ncbi:MAG: hypothetical protein K8U57_37820 [Planctomycetes bacterium]|nr:hypothetical protein [Planctomycetota bacterium]
MPIRQCDVPPEVWEKLNSLPSISTTVAPTPPPSPSRKTPTVKTDTPAGWLIQITLPCRVISEANRRDHWAVAKRRADAQAEALREAIDNAGLTNHRPPLPVAVTWTRIGKQKLDDDNLARSFKSLRDRLAEWLGIDDGDPRITWRYQQSHGSPGVTVQIESRP